MAAPKGKSLWGLAIVFYVLVSSCASAQVGVAPVYDASGNNWGITLTQYLTLYLFEELQAKDTSPVLLNPGGVYTPGDPAWLVDYAQDRPELKYLLATALKPAIIPKHGKWTLSVEMTLINRETGAATDTSTATTEIKGLDTDVASSYRDPHVAWKFGITTGRRTFDQSPLGKAAKSLAEQIRSTVQNRIPGGANNYARSSGNGAPCSMHVRVTYSYKHAASQAYTLLVNGLDQSSTIDTGVATFNIGEGPMLVQFFVEDAPYMLQSQTLYQLSTLHSCSKSTYVVDLAKGGDAHDQWE